MTSTDGGGAALQPAEAPFEGGSRRIDRVLATELDDLRELSLEEVRELRDEADQEETDLSYLRRLLQGRHDLLHAEQARRGGTGPADLLGALPAILAESGDRPSAQGLGRHRVREPSRAGESRRYVEALVSDAVISDLPTRSDAELLDTLDRLAAAETDISGRRRAVQRVFDAASTELARRYRDGEADVSALLPVDGTER